MPFEELEGCGVEVHGVDGRFAPERAQRGDHAAPGKAEQPDTTLRAENGDERRQNIEQAVRRAGPEAHLADHDAMLAQAKPGSSFQDFHGAMADDAPGDDALRAFFRGSVAF